MTYVCVLRGRWRNPFSAWRKQCFFFSSVHLLTFMRGIWRVARVQSLFCFCSWSLVFTSKNSLRYQLRILVLKMECFCNLRRFLVWLMFWSWSTAILFSSVKKGHDLLTQKAFKNLVFLFWLFWYFVFWYLVYYQWNLSCCFVLSADGVSEHRFRYRSLGKFFFTSSYFRYTKKAKLLVKSKLLRGKNLFRLA